MQRTVVALSIQLPMLSRPRRSVASRALLVTMSTAGRCYDTLRVAATCGHQVFCHRDIYLPLQVLFNHVVASYLPSTAVVAALKAASPAPVELESLLGAALEVTTDSESIFVTPAGTDVMAKVVTVDVETCAGVVHVIDKVLVPAPLAAEDDEAADDGFAAFPDEAPGAYGDDVAAAAYGDDVAGTYA